MRTSQKFYNTKVEGKVNEETWKIMKKPRCGVPNETLAFAISKKKWHKTQLEWYFSLASQDILKIARVVFEVWQNVTNLEFVHDQTQSDGIVIRVVSQRLTKHNTHYMCQTGEFAFAFQNRRGILGHGFLLSVVS